MRKFLKTVGVTSQNVIEAAVADAKSKGTMPRGPSPVSIVLKIEGLGLTHSVVGEIEMPHDEK